MARRTRLDHHGDPVLFVHVTYDDTCAPVDLEALAGLMHEMRRFARQYGEERLPHIRHDFLLRHEVVDAK